MGFNILSLGIGSSVYLTDLLDILIIAVLAYTAILFLKQTRSLTAFLGIGVLGVLYILARTFHLYITTLILQSFFSIFIIVLVIVFQDEIKKSFELLATSGTRRVKNKSFSSFSSTVFAIIQATSSLVKKKHGALIIIPGKELIERHIRGGNILDGIVTAPLLESIFDPTSPGHDGAVIIEKDRVAKFGVHLPLSQNLRELKGRGTRHSAAIGISEKIDALVITISEERGEISVAKGGRMKTLENVRELEKKLEQHYKDKFPEKPHGFYKTIFKERALEKVSAVFIALIAWFFVVFQAEIIQRDFTVPISYVNISEEAIIESTTPEVVNITFSTRGQAILNTLSPDSIRVRISGDEIESGINEIQLDRSYVEHPFNVSVVNISPDTVTISAQKYETHEVSVEANLVNQDEEVNISEIAVSPPSVKILVPTDKDVPEAVFTEKIDAGNIMETEVIETRIDLNNSYKIHQDSSRTVFVTLIIEEDD